MDDFFKPFKVGEIFVKTEKNEMPWNLVRLFADRYHKPVAEMPFA